MVVEALQAKGGRVVIDDLHGHGFNPVLTAQEMAVYYDDKVPADIADQVEHLKSAEELIFVFPIWMYHMPALLKGYFDRVWRPNVSFKFEGDEIQPLLLGLRHLTVIACHGQSETTCDLVGDGTREFFSKSIRSILPGLQTVTRFDLYGLDTADARYVQGELDRIRRHFAE